MAKLTYGQRKALPASAFAVDGKKRKYPIQDKAHARNALARVAAFGSSEEKAKVRGAVKRKYPGIEQGGGRTMVSPEGIQGAKMRRHGGRHTKG
jgi:hypothetical protein